MFLSKGVDSRRRCWSDVDFSALLTVFIIENPVKKIATAMSLVGDKIRVLIVRDDDGSKGMTKIADKPSTE